MLKISNRSTPTCIVVQAEGKISGDDYEDFADAFEDAVEKHGQINLVMELVGSVRAGDMDAVEEDFEFAFKGYKNARRAAFVGDQKLIRGMMKLFSPFTRAQEKFFDAGELDAAIEWASATE